MLSFRREPTIYLQGLSALLGLLVTFQLDWLTAKQAALIVALVTAVIAAVNASMVRPIAPAAFTGVVTALATLVAGYGLDFSQEQVGAVQAIVLTVLTLITRESVTPKSNPAPADVVTDPLLHRQNLGTDYGNTL